MKKIINSAHAPAPIGPYSQAVMAGNLLFVSGQIAINPETSAVVSSGIRDETRQVMQNIKTILTEAGLGMQHIVKSTIFLKDMNDFSAVNEIYGSFFITDFPARETVQVAALPKNVNVEISVIAAWNDQP